jgi:hypothetical protein
MLSNKQIRAIKRAQAHTALGANPKGDIRHTMSHSTVVPVGEDIVFDNTVKCAALRKGVPGGLDHLAPSTVNKQRIAELVPSRKKRTATQSQQIVFGNLPATKAAVNKAKLARTYRDACDPLFIGPLTNEGDAPGLPPPLNPHMLIDQPEFHEVDRDEHKGKEAHPSNRDDDSAPARRQNEKEEGEVEDDNGDADPGYVDTDGGDGDKGEDPRV